jgi:hypothetical protein
MQHLNNDMDELFRKAAEGYPLNTGSADWEKVHARLQEEKELLPANARDHRWMVLLLLPLVFLCNRLSDGMATEEPVAAAESLHTATGVAAPPAATNTNTPAASYPRIANKQKDILTSGSRKRVSAAVNSGSKRPFYRSVTDKPSSGGQPVASARGANNTHTMEQNGITAIGGNEPALSVISGVVSESDSAAIITVHSQDTTALPEIDSVPMDVAGTKSPDPKKSVLPKRRFFVSVVAGPDISTVKFQKFSEVGLQAGVLLGYAVSNRFAIEAGALWGRKNYNSDGRHFNKNKLYLPPNTRLVALNGYCRMIELPMTLRYLFSEGKKQSFFAAAGISSYLMQSENYDYDYLYLSSGYVARYHKSYQNQSRNWAGVMQLSAGFLHKLGGVGQLRVEPYYAVPLKGIGYGELPLSSFGLRVGITSNRF